MTPCKGRSCVARIVRRLVRFVGLVGVLLAALPVAAQDRHALVIGIDAYENVASLQKARNDAEAVAEALASTGFEVTTLLDADRRSLNRAISDFSASLQQGDEAVFYFAGHGIEVAGRNYLLPSDVPAMRPGDEVFLTSESLAADEILGAIQRSGARVSVLILDACRDNPFPQNGTRSLGQSRGLARLEAPEGAFIMFSAGTGQAALDRLSNDDPNPNSVFTRALLPLLTEPGLPIHEIARRLRREVQTMAETVGHDQRPAYYDEVTGEFILQAALPGTEPFGSTTADPCDAAREDWDLLGDEPSSALLRVFLETHQACDLTTALATDALAAAQSVTVGSDSRFPSLDATTAGLLAQCEAALSQFHIYFQAGEGPDQNATLETCTAARAAIPDLESEEGVLATVLLGRALYDVYRTNDAVDMFQSAAASGDRVALFYFAYTSAYVAREGELPADRLAMILEAAEQGIPEAMFTAAHELLYSEQENEAANWLIAAAEAGDMQAAVRLANIYSRDPFAAFSSLTFQQVIPQDYDRAFHLYQGAAQDGHRYAMMRLAIFHQEGLSTPRSASDAADWYLRSLARGVRIYTDMDVFDTDTLMVIQERLRSAGHYVGPIDGAPSFPTIRALRAYMDANIEQ